ncbi:UTRA domain-containing protein [Thalassomonas actiniarum]|uniref:UTRA domain-containing protein n=1 Tax=Thalassomonas actiniarum TaxID=485447 RepID=A0AAE9YWH1_9GAMM|nr:UTRA domain-containing protein [Thalassomonas actiniarum]WDE02466.1 UTRA domain-containing protein [Thalassomonas actiniarum]
MSLYQTIKEALADLTFSSDTPGKLPSERQLQQQFNSTRVTVREALMRLEAEGVIYRQNRIGWFLCPKRLLWDPIQKVNFYQLAKNQGLKAKTELLTCKQTRASNEICQAFTLDKQSDFYEIYRIRYLDDRPVMVEEIYCPVQQFPGLTEKALDSSITTIFQDDYQVKVSHEQSDIIVTALPDNKAEQLNLNGGAACLKIIRKRFNEQQELVDYNIEYWLHSAIEMRVQSN